MQLNMKFCKLLNLCVNVFVFKIQNLTLLYEANILRPFKLRSRNSMSFDVVTVKYGEEVQYEKKICVICVTNTLKKEL